MKWWPLLVSIIPILAGCANGPIYWSRYDATPELFQADHRACFESATIVAAYGAAGAYKACMGQHGWVRVQGRGSQSPPEPYFAGPETDAEFKR